ncbi:Zinc finger, RING/FYVE/PHD-type, partial [Nannochloropsis gaditana]
PNPSLSPSILPTFHRPRASVSSSSSSSSSPSAKFNRRAPTSSRSPSNLITSLRRPAHCVRGASARKLSHEGGSSREERVILSGLMKRTMGWEVDDAGGGDGSYEDDLPWEVRGSEEEGDAEEEEEEEEGEEEEEDEEGELSDFIASEDEEEEEGEGGKEGGRPWMHDGVRCLCGARAFGRGQEGREGGRERGRDGGIKVQCTNEECAYWGHGSCYGIEEEEEVPLDFKCYHCRPSPRQGGREDVPAAVMGKDGRLMDLYRLLQAGVSREAFGKALRRVRRREGGREGGRGPWWEIPAQYRASGHTVLMEAAALGRVEEVRLLTEAEREEEGGGRRRRGGGERDW